MTSRSLTVAIAVILAAALLALAALAQPGRGRGRGEPQYDPQTETRLEGTVAEVMEVDSPRYNKGVHIKLESGDTAREICIGPAFYLEAEDITFTVGEQLAIVGSEVVRDGREVVIARAFERGAEKVTLRDELGVPRWRRGGRRSAG